MASKCIPSDPEKVMVIRNVTPDILTCSTPFLRFGHIKIGGRATIVRMQSGTLAVFSPVALTPTLRARLATLGDKVGYITAPDLEHHMFLDAWHSAYPSAKLIGPSDLVSKREKAGNPLPFAHLWSKGQTAVDAEFEAEFEREFVGAHPNKELVVCHKPSKTLIQADLFFNLPATEQYSKTGEDAGSGWATRLFSAMNSPGGNVNWQRRFLWYAMSGADRKGWNESVRRIDGWEFDRVVPCHGDVVESGGKELFRKVMAWHLEK